MTTSNHITQPINLPPPTHSSPSPPSPTTSLPSNAPHLDSNTYLNDLPSLTPSKPTTSVSDSESDSIPERSTDDDDDDNVKQPPEDLINSIHLNPIQNSDRQLINSQPQRTPSSQTSLSTLSNSHISLSEPVPLRNNNKINRKRSLSALVALRYRGGKADSEIGEEERGLLALDLDTYINSGEPECIPETRALPPSALFPTLSAVLQATNCENQRKTAGKKKELRSSISRSTKMSESQLTEVNNLTIDSKSDVLLLPTPRSEWPFGGGIGPGNTSRGFIPGRCTRDHGATLEPSPLLEPNPHSQLEIISSGENDCTTLN